MMRLAAVSFLAFVLAQSQAMAGSSDTMPSYNGPFVLFFESDSVILPPEARNIVNKAAAVAKARSPQHVQVSLPDVSAKEGQLSGARFTAIKNALVAGGIAPRLIAWSTMAKTRT